MACAKVICEVEVLLVEDAARRRDWTVDNKIGFVEGNLRGGRQGSARALRRVPISADAMTSRASGRRSGTGRIAGVRTRGSHAGGAPIATTGRRPPGNGPQADDRDRLDKRAAGHGSGRDQSGGAGASASGSGRRMIAFPTGVTVWIAGGATDLRCGRGRGHRDHDGGQEHAVAVLQVEGQAEDVRKVNKRRQGCPVLGYCAACCGGARQCGQQG